MLNRRMPPPRDALFEGRKKPDTSHDQYAEQARNLLEEQNDQQISELSKQINTLKQLNINIHDEVVSQNDFLSRMSTDFSNTEGLLGGTLNKLGKMMEQGGGKHMWYLIMFVVVIFIILYYVIRGY